MNSKRNQSVTVRNHRSLICNSVCHMRLWTFDRDRVARTVDRRPPPQIGRVMAHWKAPRTSTRRPIWCPVLNGNVCAITDDNASICKRYTEIINVLGCCLLLMMNCRCNVDFAFRSILTHFSIRFCGRWMFWLASFNGMDYRYAK